jgi:predicted CxxxxCH...CXXCH cytochrome family protein
MNRTNNTMIGIGNAGFNCVDCHAQIIINSDNLTIANRAKHVTGMVDYSGAKAGKIFDASTKVCSNVYCHSNGNPNAIVFVNMTGSKVWSGAGATGTIATCNKCHGRSNAFGYPDYANIGPSDPKSNLHAGHMAGMTDTKACADCHRKTADTTSVNTFRPYTSAHLSGVPNVYFYTAKNYIGTKANVATAGYQVTCSGIVCHGQGAPVWGYQKTGSGAAGVRTCTKCHGSASSDYTAGFTNFSSPMVAPGYGSDGTDTSMTKKAPTDPRVGAHQRHLASNMLAAPIKCGECHVVVTAIRSANHWNYSTATLTFTGSVRATANSHSPSVTRTGGIRQCSNINCHAGKYNSGSTMAPFWNVTGLVKETGTTVASCTKCHAMPPTAYTKHPQTPLNDTDAISTIYASCGSCHTNLKSSGVTNVGNVFNDKSLHINGAMNYVSNCDSCHGYDNVGASWTSGVTGGSGSGAHYKHLVFIKSRLGIGSLTATGQTFGLGEPAGVCGTCHTNTVGEHDNGSRQITFGTGGTTNTMGAGYIGKEMSLMFGGSNPAFSGAAKTCSNLSCHYFTTPSWY